MTDKQTTVLPSGFFGILALIFITLKLTGYIAWSWWWVLAPLWLPPLIFCVVFSLVLVGVAVIACVLYILNK